MFEKFLSWAENRMPAGYRTGLTAKLRSLHGKLTSDGARGKSARAAMLIFSVRIFSAVLAFLLQVFLARWMGSAQYGAFVLVTVVAMMMGGLSCLGLQTAVIRFVTEYRAKRNVERLHGILLAAPGIAIAASLVIVFITWQGLYWFGDYLTNIYIIPFYLALIYLPFLALEEVQEGIARSYDMPLTALAPSFILRPISILLIMALAYSIGYPPNAVTALASAAIAISLSTIAQSLMLWGRVIRQNKIEFPASEVSPNAGHDQSANNSVKYSFQFGYWISVALPIFMAGGFYSLLVNVDVVFIGYFLSPEAVAIYYAVLKSLAVVHFVLFAMRASSAHHFSRYFSDGDTHGLSEYALKITQWTFWPTLILAVTMVLMGKYILMLFGAEFVEGQFLLAILAMGIVVRSAIGPAESLLAMTGHQNITMLVFAITLCFNIALNFTLIPRFGVSGAAIATSTAMLFETAALYAAISRKMGFRMFVLGSGKPLPDKGLVT